MKLNKKEYLLIILLILSWIVFYFFCNDKKECIEISKIPELKETIDTFQNEIVYKEVKGQIDTVEFIEYWETGSREQIAFKTKSLKSAKVKLFPNYGTRKKLDYNEVSNVYGINQFFMDFQIHCTKWKPTSLSTRKNIK